MEEMSAWARAQGIFRQRLRAQTTRDKAAVIELADTLALDGIDIDIEGQLLTEIDRAGDYTPFIAALSGAMKARCER